MKILIIFVLLSILLVSSCDDSDSLIQRKYRIKYQVSAVGDAVVTYVSDYGVQKTKAFNKNFEFEFENREDVDFFIKLAVNDTSGGIVTAKLLLDGKEKQKESSKYYVSIAGSLKELK